MPSFRLKSSKSSSLRLGDMVRLATGTAALRSRSLPKVLEETPLGKNYLSRGRYANDLMRLDDMISDSVEQERELDEAERVVTRKNIIGKTVITDSFVRDYLLAQELLLAAHNAVDEMRNIARETGDPGDEKINLIVHYRNGNYLWNSDQRSVGVSMRFTVLYADKAAYESFAYMHNGTQYLTRLSLVSFEAMSAMGVDKREWPMYTDIEVSNNKHIIAVDESLSRFAGSYVTSDPHDTLGGRTWLDMDSDTSIVDFHQRLLPEKKDNSIDDPMESITSRSMFAANYSGFEAVLLAVLAVLLASVAWQSGAWWTAIPLLLAAVLAAAIGWLFKHIMDSMLRVDLMRKIEKPLPRVWRAANLLRIALVPFYTFLLMTAMSMITLRGKSMELSDFHANSYTYTQTLAVALAVGFWLLFARRIPMMSKFQLITASMKRFSTTLDMIVGTTLVALVVALSCIEGTLADRLTLFSLAVALLVAELLVAWFGKRVAASLVQPLRMLDNTSCTHYVHDDRGMSRDEWFEKNGVAL